MRKPVTLIAGEFGSPHFGTSPHLEEAVRLARKEAPQALYIGAASGDDETFGTALCALIGAAGASDVFWPKLTKRPRDKSVARKALARVDFVFVGGGDVEAGMDVLRRAQLIAELRAAAARGVVFAGMSAGAIMLGERWVRWPRADATDDEAETYECLGLAPCALDTHGEGDRWGEARSFAAVRARELKRKARAFGIPSGGALVVRGGGKMHARGKPVPVFVASPRGAATIERTLPAEKG
ncbi:MAG TPA: Type 1 glutamine amidotransferase-like domain-containing protein [Gammaproteobacteria bacterium]|nr:Type 1 glutamine amidotransferase-like domain-containing protein [Gammaproteobacteria bacterium]